MLRGIRAGRTVIGNRRWQLPARGTIARPHACALRPATTGANKRIVPPTLIEHSGKCVALGGGITITCMRRCAAGQRTGTRRQQRSVGTTRTVCNPGSLLAAVARIGVDKPANTKREKQEHQSHHASGNAIEHPAHGRWRHGRFPVQPLGCQPLEQGLLHGRVWPMEHRCTTRRFGHRLHLPQKRTRIRRLGKELLQIVLFSGCQVAVEISRYEMFESCHDWPAVYR